jgi:acylphosphatase
VVIQNDDDVNVIYYRAMERYTFRVDGKVQGVWFRRSTMEKAKELGLKGFVQNEPDGSVYVEAEGEKSKLIALVSWCLDGPENAEVFAMTIVKGPAAGYSDFVIREAVEASLV